MYWQSSKWEIVKGHHWYTLNVPVSTPKGSEKAAPPTAPSLVNDAADHLAGNWPEFHVDPLKESDQALLDRERVQLALNHTFDLLAREFGKAIHRTLAIHGGWSGMMCASVHLHDGWDVKNPRIEDIYWQPRDPRFVFPDPGTLGKEFVIYRMRRTVGSIRQTWPDWEGNWYEPRGWGDMNTGPDQLGTRLRERLPDATVVDWLEYWDDKVKCFIANGFPVFRPKYGMDILPHGLGCQPFIIQPAGYGDDTGEPHERFRSMLYYVFYLLTLEANLLTQLRWIVEDMAWPVWLAPESMRGLDVTPGTINYVPDKTDIAAFKAMREDAVEPKAVTALLAWVQSAIERATYPVVLKGNAPEGVKAGYPIAILSTQAKLKFASPSDALRAMLEKLMAKTLTIISERIEKSTEVVKGISLKPTDLENYWGRIHCDLEPNLPTDRAAMVPILEFAVGSLGLPKVRGLQELGFEDPEQLRKLRKAEDIEDDPRVLQELVHTLLQRMSPDYAMAVENVNNDALRTQQIQSRLQMIQSQLQLTQAQQQLQQLEGQGGETPPTPPGVPGQAGGSNTFGQNPGNPNSTGQAFSKVNPDTALRTMASEARAQRTLSDYFAQTQAYGGTGGGEGAGDM